MSATSVRRPTAVPSATVVSTSAPKSGSARSRTPLLLWAMIPVPPWARATFAGPGATGATAALATASASATASALRLARAVARPRFISHPPCDAHRRSGPDHPLAARAGAVFQRDPLAARVVTRSSPATATPPRPCPTSLTFRPRRVARVSSAGSGAGNGTGDTSRQVHTLLGKHITSGMNALQSCDK